MKHRENDHASWFNTVEDGIGKTRDKSAAHLAVGAREHLRIALDRVKRRINGGKKPFAKPRDLLFVVPESGSEIPPNLPAVNNRQSH